ncbi:pyruvate decarboxylase [Kaistella sp.]|uniref:pyruvate decarboxylase n=1 Tax=Kaistella sp. TaxID=2782235 RepID=UPI002F94CA83
MMNHLYLFALGTFLFFTGCQSLPAQNITAAKDLKNQNIIHFNPEVFPDIDEIKEPTYTAFYAAVSEKTQYFRNYNMLRVDSYMPYDAVDVDAVVEYCKNNNAQLAVIPKVKYFKVGVGKYVFSNQVIISMKLYDSLGNFLAETNYDTYRKNARILGSAENSIKIGATGAMTNLGKNLRKSKTYSISGAN